jgi:tetratricopeptide (TPR) repeat protein
MLRSAGVHADLVLVDSGPGVDVARDMPGMGEFDHAIVRAQSQGKDVWIDATEDLRPAGQLPSRDQGRHALIIAPGTLDLITTPFATSRDNAFREVRTFHIPEHDRSTVTEVSSESGVFDGQRSWLRAAAHDEIQKSLSHYVDQTYEGKLASFRIDDTGDVTRPSSLTLEIADSPRAFTSRSQIDVHLFPSAVLTRVPSALKDSDDQDHKRRFEFLFSIPHVEEVENRLEIPTGFTIPELPTQEVQLLGTMTLTTTRRVERGTLVITYRLDTGKARLLPAEFTATRKALLELQNKNGEHVIAMRTAVLLLQQAKANEALAECQRLIALHPKEALHHDQLAELFRATGLGAAARREARRGIDAEPKASDGYAQLGFFLRHDSLGRDFGFDADRKGAIAAYRKALELDPKHLGALVELAGLLVVDEHGQPSEDSHDRREAISLWRRAKEIAKRRDYDGQIATNPLVVGDFADAEATARAMAPSRQRSLLLVASIAAQKGVHEALIVASSLGSEEERKQILGDASGALLITRRYDLARALFDQGKDANTNPAQAAIMARIAPVDPAKLDTRDPKTPALLALSRLMGLHVDHAPWDAELDKHLARLHGDLRTLPGLATWRLMSPAVAFDLVAALAKTSVEGSAAEGWHVTQDFGAGKGAGYVVSESGRAKLVATNDLLAGAGRHVLALLAKNDVAGATRWLDWVRADLSGRHSPQYDAVAAVFKDQPSDAAPPQANLEIAAALLVAESDAKIAAPILRRCAGASDAVKKRCRAGLLNALVELDQWAEIAEVARQMSEQDPSAADALATRAEALARTGKLGAAIAALDEALARHPDEIALLRLRAQLAVAAKKPDDARTWLDKLVHHPAARAMDFNNAAWVHLFLDATADAALELAKHAEQMDAKLSMHLANTLSVIEAEAGQPSLAWSYTQKAIAATSTDVPGEEDWYVLGRMAESLGLRDDAVTAYRRLTKPKHHLTGQTSYELAQRGLRRLGPH